MGAYGAVPREELWMCQEKELWLGAEGGPPPELSLLLLHLALAERWPRPEPGSQTWGPGPAGSLLP